MLPLTPKAFRRCHHCDHLSEGVGRISYCAGCAKPFAPFYYFDDQTSPVYLDLGLRPPELGGEWRPIQGLTAYWDMD